MSGVLGVSPAFSGCTGGNGTLKQGTAVPQQPANPGGPATTTTATVTLLPSVIPVASTAGFKPDETIYLGAPALSTWNNGVLTGVEATGGNAYADQPLRSQQSRA